jgi:DnaJ-class molecular chaperone
MKIPEGYKECPDCFGAGTVEIEVQCKRCRGTGMKNGDICCGGVDEVEAECETCDGLGYVEDEDYVPKN